MLTADTHGNIKATVACRPLVPNLWVETLLYRHRLEQVLILQPAFSLLMLLLLL